ncbi:hypothetical protein [Ornithinimicrobium sediminis]|uniref:hypothetical protein n=1 Tax=Ornithinimicrobium sediminis TaxID=2904603 RepID=UPI001E5257A4|nr:hypothetical protein [Ornithinimicrobium sediminis]MCE0488218.1 hypothetical protein [Ornithinimicrobium sediminis]
MHRRTRLGLTLWLSAVVGVTGCGEDQRTTTTSTGTGTSAKTATPTGTDVRSPVAEGTYSGTFTVLEDSTQAPDGEDAGSVVGADFEAEVTLRGDCDDSDQCTVQHDSVLLHYPEEVEPTWTMERAEDRWTATSEGSYEEDCVDEAGNVYGTFHSDVSYELTMEKSEEVDGRLVWTTMTFTFVEDTDSPDTEQGCYASRYVVEGALSRTS